jgi:hypothetical protein
LTADSVDRVSQTIERILVRTSLRNFLIGGLGVAALGVLAAAPASATGAGVETVTGPTPYTFMFEDECQEMADRIKDGQTGAWCVQEGWVTWRLYTAG